MFGFSESFKYLFCVMFGFGMYLVCLRFGRTQLVYLLHEILYKNMNDLKKNGKKEKNKNNS